jgi:hypothetical protein
MAHKGEAYSKHTCDTACADTINSVHISPAETVGLASMKECSVSGSTTVKRPVPKADTSWAAYGILFATISSEGLLFGVY